MITIHQENNADPLLGHKWHYSGTFSGTQTNTEQCNILCYVQNETETCNMQQKKRNIVRNSLAALRQWMFPCSSHNTAGNATAEV